MFYDLHIHSCLSPCAEDEMTPNNICNMAQIKGLSFIAVTDHNSTRQLPAVAKVASQLGLKMLYGCEIESNEEVHVLAYFPTLDKALAFQKWLDEMLPYTKNDKDYFGNQWVCDELDQVIAEEERLLIVSLKASLEECIDAIHQYGGKAVLAHVLDRVNSITHQLGFIPQGLPYDGIEIKNDAEKLRVLKMHPWIKEEDTLWFVDSDAHHLIDISEEEHSISKEELQKYWGESFL